MHKRVKQLCRERESQRGQAVTDEANSLCFSFSPTRAIGPNPRTRARCDTPSRTPCVSPYWSLKTGYAALRTPLNGSRAPATTASTACLMRASLRRARGARRERKYGKPFKTTLHNENSRLFVCACGTRRCPVAAHLQLHPAFPPTSTPDPGGKRLACQPLHGASSPCFT